MNLAEASDGDLAALARAGRQQAYRVLIERHRESVYRLVRSAIGDAEEALDVTQETFVAAFAALDRFDPARPFRTWIARIAFNKARDWARRRAVRRFFSFAMPEDTGDLLIDPAAAQDQVAEDRQALDRVSAVIAALPPALKETLLLRTIDGMGQADAAAVLGVSEKTVETRLYRARQRLREMLADEPARTN